MSCERVFHCDIKPENILMDDDENPVFADFGISEILLDQSKWFGLTEEELATSWWRDPLSWKAFRSNKTIMYQFSVLSDLWSLVLTIFAIFLVNITMSVNYSMCSEKGFTITPSPNYGLMKRLILSSIGLSSTGRMNLFDHSSNVG